MSDFDEEAERERLREKYERDKQKREASERMSELLLKGATMTNAHCDTCGDPIFRYDGQEFCPTCQVPKGEDTEATAPDAEPDAESEAASSREGRTANGQSDAGIDHESPPEPKPQGESRETPPEPETPEPETPEPQSNAEPASEPHEVIGSTAPKSAPADADGVAEARAALERTLTDAARRAEAAEDARSRREHLGAAKEAAEALAALRNAR